MSSEIETLHGNAQDRLRSFVERWERLEEEKQSIAHDQREVMAEAKSAGYDAKALRACIKARKKDDQERLEEEAIEESYRHALGIGRQLDMFREGAAAEPSPITVLANSFDSIAALASAGGSEVQFNGKGFCLTACEDGSVSIRPIAAKKKAA